jgi:hypothetical protein
VRDLAWVVLLREELHIAAYCLNDVPCGTTAFSCGPTPGLRLTYRQQRKPRIDQCRRLLPAVSCPNPSGTFMPATRRFKIRELRCSD